AHRIQPYFVPGTVHQLEIIERLLRAGIYKGPLNLALCGYGGGTMGRNPYDWMEMLRRAPHGSVPTFWSSMRGNIALQTMAIVLGVHVRVGNEDNIWDAHRRRWDSVRQVEWAVKQAEQFGRKVATAEEARSIMKVGVWYDTVEETLFNAALPPNRPAGYTGFLTYDTNGRLPQTAHEGPSPVSIL
ncbi:MAG TPA: 3-keto-5-aminohexanoate cleavage protein, partial [Candidatus Tumulicola sp.]|nr:3-keto-5-aminohexanoate cleavage protein [Candidatus Tumulicola sp.]